MTLTTIYEAVRNYKGRRTDTERAFDLEAAKTRIRNHVHLDQPSEWVEMDRHGRDGYILQNTPSDVEVEIYERCVHGSPTDTDNTNQEDYE